MMCKICDKHYGRFHRLYVKVSLIVRTLKPENSDNDGDESDSSNLSNPVASVATKADGSSKTKKRKRSTAEEGKKVDE